MERKIFAYFICMSCNTSLTLVLMVVPSARWTIFEKPDSSIATTYDKYLMVPLGSSLARASNNNFLLAQ